MTYRSSYVKLIMLLKIAEFSVALKSLAVANKVALNPINQMGDLILWEGGAAFNVEYNSKVPEGGIMMPGLYRNHFSLKIGDTIDCMTLRRSKISTIHYMTVSIDYFLDRDRPTDVNAYSVEFLLDLLRHLRRLVLTTNVPYLIPAEAINLRVTVQEMMYKDGESLEVVRHGVFSGFPDPTITIVSPLLTVRKQAYNQAIFKESNLDFESLGVGGMDEQFKDIFRRAFASRSVHPEELKKLGIKHQKGILLYGPPGTGKTTIARSLCKVLNSHDPVIIDGPEVLDKYVGGSEAKIRELFQPAEKEYVEKGDYSQLHVLVFDEFDSLCRHRSSGSDVGSNVANNIVN